MEYDRGDGEDVRELEKASNGIFLQVAYIVLVVGKRLEVVFEAVQLEWLAFSSELLCLGLC